MSGEGRLATGRAAAPPATADTLLRRLLSSVLILPSTLALLVVGGHAVAVLVVVLAGCMAWEWATMTAPAGGRRLAALAGGASAAAVAAAILSPLGGALPLACLAAVWIGARLTAPHAAARLTAGCLVVALPCYAAYWLRTDIPGGLVLVIWVAATVIATDIGAYAAGRLIGGPKLAPRISPGKTWAGLFGGVAAGMAVGAGFAAVAEPLLTLALLTVLSGGLAAVAQIGDLCESAVKRACGVKDSGRLIPGHGGVLDRLDGHLSAFLVTGAAVLASGQHPFPG